MQVLVPRSNLPLDPHAILGFLAPLDFTTCSIGPVYSEWQLPSDYGPMSPPAAGMSIPHRRYGFGVALKGPGHEQVTSRRKLAHGPWRVLRDEAHDVTLLQFHDHLADAATALDQATWPMQRFGYSELWLGIFFNDKHPFPTEPKGSYNPETRRIRIVAYDGHAGLHPMHVLDCKALAWFVKNGLDDQGTEGLPVLPPQPEPEPPPPPKRRAVKRRRAGQERDLERPAPEPPPPAPAPCGRPVDGVDLVFYDREEAESARLLCWLHEIGCLWQEDATNCHDMLEDYEGIPVKKPDWVQEVESRDAANGEP